LSAKALISTIGMSSGQGEITGKLREHKS
jgi:hypothetical protein